MMSVACFVLLASCLTAVHGYQCHWPGNDDPNNFISAVKNTVLYDCPRILDSSDKQYCCLDTNGDFKCCNLVEFALTYIIIAVVVVAVLSALCSIICCCCCPCCTIYKRRHGNIV